MDVEKGTLGRRCATRRDAIRHAQTFIEAVFDWAASRERIALTANGVGSRSVFSALRLNRAAPLWR